MENEEKNKNIIEGDVALTLLTKEPTKYCTLDLSVHENQVALYNCLQKCDVRLIDIKGQTIEIENIFIERKDVVAKNDKDEDIINEKTGEVMTKPKYKTVLFGTDGKTYVSGAYGIYNSISQIISIFGTPSKDHPYKVTIATKSLKTGETLILILANE